MPNIKHSDLTQADGIHGVITAEVADTAALVALSFGSPIEVRWLGCLVLQVDTQEVWRVSDVNAIGAARFTAFGAEGAAGADNTGIAFVPTSGTAHTILDAEFGPTFTAIQNSGGVDLALDTESTQTLGGVDTYVLEPSRWALLMFETGSSPANYIVMDVLGKTPNAVPTSDFSFSSTSLVTAFTSLAVDSDGTIAAHSWRIHDLIDPDDVGTTILETFTTASPSRTDVADGTYYATYQAQDNSGAWSLPVTKSYTVVEVAAPADDLAVTGAVPIVSFQPTGLALADNAAVASVDDLQGVSNMTITSGATYKTAGIGSIDFPAAAIGTFGTTTSLKFLHDSATPAWTIAGVIDSNNTTYQTLFRTRSSTPTPGVMLHSNVADGDRYRLEQYSDSATDRVTSTPGGMTTGWIDLVIVTSGDTTTFYINGTSIVVNGAPAIFFDGPHDVAEISPSAALALRDFRVYDVALSGSQLAERTAAISSGNYTV